ncbi:hypothetical protein, partial [Nonomuraea aridisoli]|uniref:hypothetical protein n=1 Tax=Nonomuraea aridisoli TaxID=2070368 RepID=UPI001C650896
TAPDTPITRRRPTTLSPVHRAAMTRHGTFTAKKTTPTITSDGAVTTPHDTTPTPGATMTDPDGALTTPSNTIAAPDGPTTTPHDVTPAVHGTTTTPHGTTTGGVMVTSSSAATTMGTAWTTLVSGTSPGRGGRFVRAPPHQGALSPSHDHSERHQEDGPVMETTRR